MEKQKCVRKVKAIVCAICKKIIPSYSASVEMANEEMEIYFSMLPHLDETGEQLDLCPVCLQKAVANAKIVIYASDAAWKKFGSPREK